MNKQDQEKAFPESMIETIKKAVNTALLHHKAVGNKVAFLKNGKIVHEIPSNAKMG